MNIKNLALATVVTAPNPATTGTTIVLEAGAGSRFPDTANGDFFVTAMPSDDQAHIDNSEILKVTDRTGDVLTVVRKQRGSTAKAIGVDWIIINSVYEEDLNNIDATSLNGYYATQITPVGAIMPYAGSTAPSQFLLCQGQAISRDDYANLFAVIGETYGIGDGSSTFNLPNLEGKIPVGKSTETEFDTLGKTGGAKTHLHTLADGYAMLNHQDGIVALMRRKLDIPSWISHSKGTGGEGAASNTGLAGVQLGGSTDLDSSLQPYITLNYIIRY